ncbi:LPXTG cell wall anchor domain-containing protein [Enterococcus sp. BWB1-3]|uniref:LPXTG cell wall anchor domain-containing protein n=1 Tax=Enterococcus sp. BWB1-3 TaxID=2787713 RepID=UPI0019222277|nr:LPXTG cell wall anchor domain-containing protein [Enterococcus sp. BWB1-3]MBL1229707.1 LPXTG cell wall anchor domain-containing protein [Enterococcus sp. BWB1-3]
MKKRKFLKLFVVTVCLNYSAQILPFHSIVAEATSGYEDNMAGDIIEQDISIAEIPVEASVAEEAIEVLVAEEAAVAESVVVEEEAAFVEAPVENEVQNIVEAEQFEAAELAPVEAGISPADEVSGITPTAVVNNFDISSDGNEMIPGQWYDLPTYISGKYLADNILNFVESYEVTLTSSASSVTVVPTVIDGSFYLDVSGFSDGEYTVQINAIGYTDWGDGELDPQYWTTPIKIELKSTDAAVIPDATYNPNSIDTSFQGDDNNWVIKNEAGEVVAQGSGEVIDDSILSTLGEGNYTVENTATATTKKGSEVPPTTVTGTFTIRHPESTTTVDKPINPDSITGTQKITDSVLTWEIKDSSGTVVASGTGNEVPQSIIDGLEDGDYTVKFTETSPEGEPHATEGSFTIRYPETTTTVDKPVNPDSITGTQKIPGSELTWEIKDSEGRVVKSGTGSEVPQDIINALENGEYIVEFTEISPEGETHTTNGSFTVRHPEATVSIDKTENPDSITGGQKIPDSELTWVIKDKDGTIIAEGAGNTVPQDVISGLTPGNYTVEFTEISPEGESSVAIQEFVITEAVLADPVDPAESTTPAELAGTTVTGTNNAKPVGSNPTTGKKTLPQTGESNPTWLASFGAMLGLTGLAGFVRRRKDGENS